jgi:predicted TIM-barrel fold metal-dependent hydrolase
MRNPLTGQPMAAIGLAAHEKATLDVMQRLGIVKAVVFDNGEDYNGALQWKKDAPGKVIAGMTITDPAKVDVTFLRNEFKAGRLQMIGEVAQQYLGIAPNDPRMEPVFALAEELDLPIGLHMFPGGPPGQAYFPGSHFRAALGDPLLLEDVLVHHTKLRIYVMHAGWTFLDQMLATMYAYPNVNVDLGVISWLLPRAEFYRYLRALVQAGYSKRIMFGSDSLGFPENIGIAVDAVKSADFLTSEQRSDILYHNAARFFRLEPTPRSAPPGAMETLPR